MHFKCLLADSQWRRLFASFKHHQDLLLSTIFCIGTTFCISRSSALLLRKNHFLFNHDDGSFGSLNLAFLALLNFKTKTQLNWSFLRIIGRRRKKPYQEASIRAAQKVELFFCFVITVADCKLSEWSEWSSCDRSCGKGVQSRTRVVVQHPSPGRPPCEALEQKRGCLGYRCSLIDRKYKSPIRGKYLVIFKRLNEVIGMTLAQKRQ